MFGGLGRDRARRRVERALAEQPAWRVLAPGRGWICPFCAEAAVDPLPEGAGDAAQAVLAHLEGKPGCPGWDEGEGAERSIAELHRAAAQRELRRRVRASLLDNPAWQLIDAERRWYCPYCAEPTRVVVPADRRMTDEVTRGIAGHLEGCFAHRKGVERPYEQLKGVVRQANQQRKLVDNVRGKLEGDPAWRRRDARGRWVCPYCLVVQDGVDLSTNLLMFETAPGLIAKHLAQGCAEFRAGAAPRPLEEPAARTISSGRLPPPSDLGALLRGDDGAGLDEDVLAEPVVPEVPATDPRGRRRRDSGRPRDERPRDERPEPAAPARGRPDPAKARSDVWGRDAELAEGRKRLTLRELESSGEMLLIDDPEVREIMGRSGVRPPPVEAAPGPRPAPARPVAASPPAGPAPEAPGPDGPAARRSAEWRREIEEELARVRSLAPGASGELPSLAAGGGTDEGLRELSWRLGLPARGLELGKLDLPGAPPQGDFVDALEVDGRLVLLAGGVVGDEPDAPLIAALARTTLRRHAALGPAAALRRANAELFADLEGRVFVALGVAELDADGAILRVARAGLPPPLLLNPARQDGLLALASEGMALGIDRGPTFDEVLEERPVSLEHGDLLVVFTPGLLAARGEAGREALGHDRLLALIRRYGGHEVEYLLDKLREALELWAPADLRGADVELVALSLGRSEAEAWT